MVKVLGHRGACEARSRISARQRVARWRQADEHQLRAGLVTLRCAVEVPQAPHSHWFRHLARCWSKQLTEHHGLDFNGR
ncbi:hypothetical protein VM98_28465 [Streptomyces rubellomurinus subsp. indigoferus]|nr:hypothetical protein VM98_28465 [Streptomyces rubellomurinus subsp. indigoferus]